MKMYPALTSGLFFLIIACFARCNREPGTSPVDKIYRSTLSGRVIDKKGKGISGVAIVAQPDGHTTVSNIDGYFSLPDLTGGIDYTLHLSRHEYLDTTSGSYRLGYDEKATIVSDIKMVWRYGSISGIVLIDSSGADTARSGGIEIESQGISKQLVNGTFNFPKVEPSEKGVRLTAVMPGKGFGFLDVPLKADTIMENVILFINQNGGSITGTVADTGNVPLAGVTVTVLGGALSTKTDSTGRYVLNNIPSVGAIEVTYKAPDGKAVTIGNVRSEENKIVQINQITINNEYSGISEGLKINPSQTIVYSKDSAITASVNIEDQPDSTPILGYYWDYDGSNGIDDSTTTSWITIAPSLFIWKDKETSRFIYVTLKSLRGILNEKIAIKVSLLDPVDILPVLLSGVIKNKSGLPVAGVTINLHTGNASAITDSNGAYIFKTDSLHNATDTISAIKSGYIIKTFTIDTNAGILPTIILDSISCLPRILKQPSDTTIIDSSVAHFSVNASGDSILTYLWLKNDSSITKAAASYTTPVVRLSESGTMYRCIVTNFAGSCTSSTATLFVTPKPAHLIIDEHPEDITIFDSTSTTFSVKASGSKQLQFQWVRNDTILYGATDSIYSTPVMTTNDSGAHYWCIVWSAGDTVISDKALLSVITISSQVTIHFDEPLTDSLSVSVEIDKHAFFGTAGDMIVTVMDPVDPFFNATVTILSPEKNILFSNSSTNGESNYMGVKLTESGLHTITIKATNGDQTTNYSLGAYSRKSQLTSSPLISFDSTVTDSFNNTVDINSYLFQGSANDMVSVIIDPSEPYFNGTVMLVAPDDNIVKNFTSSNGSSIYIDTLLPADGIYTIIFMPATGDQITGYKLGINSSKHLLNTSRTIIYDTPVYDSTSSAVHMNAYLFQGSKNDIVSVGMAPSNPDYNGVVVISAPDGAILTSNTSLLGATNIIERVSLPENGIYTLFIFSKFFDQTTNYSLNISKY